MKFIFVSFLYLLPIFSFAVVLEGVAKNSKGEILYFEKHNIEMDENGLNLFIKVEYYKPDGKIFASMKSDFSKNKTIPETVFEDSRFNSISKIRISNKNVEFEELINNKIISTKIYDLIPSMVASQGFDNFIKLNALKLNENPIEFKFGVIDTQDFYLLKGYKIKSESKEILEFGIQASNWLARLFVNELKIVYDSKTFKLKSFAGRSNILDDSENSQNVFIEYTWKDKT